MANWLKWLIGGIAACIAITLFVQTIDPIQVFTPSERRQLFRLTSELDSEERKLREIMWADSLLPAVPSTRGVHVDVRSPLRPANDSVLRDVVRTETAWVGDPVARVAVFVIPDTLGRYYERHSVGARAVYFAGTDEHGARCAAVVPVPTIGNGEYPPAARFASPILGPCMWWARYGQPGARIAEWLRTNNAYMLGEWPQAPTAPVTHMRVRRRFAQRADVPGLSAYGLSCVQGDADDCLHALTPPSGIPADDASDVAIYRAGYFWRYSHFNGRDRFIFAELEQEFGRERFAQFWRSDADVATAFQRAFGIPLGEWMRQWASARFPHVRTASGTKATTLTLSALTLLLLCSTGVVDAMRRQIR